MTSSLAHVASATVALEFAIELFAHFLVGSVAGRFALINVQDGGADSAFGRRWHLGGLLRRSTRSEVAFEQHIWRWRWRWLVWHLGPMSGRLEGLWWFGGTHWWLESAHARLACWSQGSTTTSSRITLAVQLGGETWWLSHLGRLDRLRVDDRLRANDGGDHGLWLYCRDILRCDRQRRIACVVHLCAKKISQID